ncbi:hypothetical protein D3C76_1509470 [compost metagenome]
MIKLSKNGGEGVNGDDFMLLISVSGIVISEILVNILPSSSNSLLIFCISSCTVIVFSSVVQLVKNKEEIKMDIVRTFNKVFLNIKFPPFSVIFMITFSSYKT